MLLREDIQRQQIHKITDVIGILLASLAKRKGTATKGEASLLADGEGVSATVM
jgi:hypothetical protein